jgi:hypothetical protein
MLRMMNVNMLLYVVPTKKVDGKMEKKKLHHPEIESGAQRWQRWILPLNQ